MNKKQIASYVGGALAASGLIFVAYRLIDLGHAIELDKLSVLFWIACGGLAMIYGASNVLLALAYKNLLAANDSLLSTTRSFRLYGISQLAKYVPGNIFHLASRQAIGAQDSVKQSALAKATLWELSLLAVCAAAFIPLLLPSVFPKFPALVSSALACLLGAAFCTALRALTSTHIARAAAYYMIFFSAMGAVFAVLTTLLPGTSFSLGTLLTIAGAFVVAWLGGFLTPGAPAGVGVREAILLFSLGHILVEPNLVLAIILARMVTVFGDVLTYFAAIYVAKHNLKSNSVRS